MESYFSYKARVSNLIMKIADESVAEVYYCNDVYSKPQAQLTVIIENSHNIETNESRMVANWK